MKIRSSNSLLSGKYQNIFDTKHNIDKAQYDHLEMSNIVTDYNSQAQYRLSGNKHTNPRLKDWGQFTPPTSPNHKHRHRHTLIQAVTDWSEMKIRSSNSLLNGKYQNIFNTKHNGDKTQNDHLEMSIISANYNSQVQCISSGERNIDPSLKDQGRHRSVLNNKECNKQNISMCNRFGI